MKNTQKKERLTLPNDMSKWTKEQLRSQFYKRKRHGEHISDEMNNYMFQYYPERYYPEKRDFGPKKLEYCSPTSVRLKYYSMIEAGEYIDDEMNEYLSKHFRSYDPETRTFAGLGYANKKDPKPKDSEVKKSKPKQNVTKSRKQKTKLVDDDSDNNIDAAFILQQRPTPQLPQNVTTVKEADESILVRVDKGTYKNVYINDIPVIQQAQKVKIKKFLDNTVLGVHYTDRNGVQQWDLWDAATRPIMKNKQNWIIESVNAMNDVLYAITDTHAQIKLSKKNIMRDITKAGRFVIESKKSHKR